MGGSCLSDFSPALIAGAILPSGSEHGPPLEPTSQDFGRVVRRCRLFQTLAHSAAASRAPSPKKAYLLQHSFSPAEGRLGIMQPFRNIAVVCLSTAGSRVLGLLRDVFIFAALGASLWNSAFILAFTLPNLFRRLLGEGALTSAMIPVLSDVVAEEGKVGALSFFNRVVSRLVLALGLIVGLGMSLLALAALVGGLPERWQVGVELSFILLPYMLLICTGAVVVAALNLLGRFAVGACAPVLLNLSMIAALGIAMVEGMSQAETVYWLCGGVLCGGFLQLLFPVVDLKRQGWRPRLQLGSEGRLTTLWTLFVPGVLGAAILQLNILVSRLLAYSLDASAASVLYLASRLMELPLGIFTIAVATVFFPLLSKALSESDEAGFAVGYRQGCRLILAITIPAGMGLAVLAEPILATLFLWGAFDAGGVARTVPLVAIYGLGLPFYSAATFATRGLHATKDMRTPVRVAAVCLAVNALGGLGLMQVAGAAGLAAANVLAAALQAALLSRAFARQHRQLARAWLGPTFLKVSLAAVFMGLFCLVLKNGVEGAGLEAKAEAALGVLLIVPAGVGLYAGLLWCLRFEEFDTLAKWLRRDAAERKLD